MWRKRMTYRELHANYARVRTHIIFKSSPRGRHGCVCETCRMEGGEVGGWGEVHA